MFIRQILSAKGDSVVSTRPDALMAEVVDMMQSQRIGAVVVLDGDGRLCGIISERDVTGGLAKHRAGMLELQVEQLMTAKVVTCAPGDSVHEVMQMMTSGRFRHLPVLEDGRMIGIISIGDVVKSRLQELEAESNQLQDYIAGAA